MISKHILCKTGNDNYKRLANYIADASHKGEKCLASWCAGCDGSDNNYQDAIDDVIDIQAMNNRTTKEKTYHLVVSFRPEDEGKLSEQDYKIIEEHFAKTLGFEEHQRHCGVHKNTDNLHMHVAYNMIHQESFRRHEPFRDFYKLEQACREIEQKYNLSIDNGIDKEDTSHKLSQSSATKESLTGEESFESYAIRHKTEIMEQIEKAQTWEDVHKAFASFGMECKKQGNGLAIKNLKGKQAFKASKFDREISYKKLADRLGNFQKQKQAYKAKDWYKKKPLQKMNKQNKELWQEYLKQNTYKEELLALKEKTKKQNTIIEKAALGKKSKKNSSSKQK